MKYYNIQGYIRHKKDLEQELKRLEQDIVIDKDNNVDYTTMDNNTIIKMWMPLCEALARNLGGAKQTKTKTEKTRDPNIVILERELSDVLGTSVEISHNNKGKGKLVINFKSLDALQGVLEKIKS